MNVEGVVLRRWDSGESDRRIAILTRERGKIYATARGARKAKSKLAGVSEPLMTAEFHLAVGRKNSFVTQAQPVSAFGGLRDDYRKLMCGLAFAEIIDAIIVADEQAGASDIFDLCAAGLVGIDQVREPVGALCWADLMLMRCAGFEPEFRVSVESGAVSKGDSATLCPSAGGLVIEGEVEARDTFEVPRVIAVTLAKLQQLESPPDFVKRADETARALLPFWLQIAGRDLPARKHLLSGVSTPSHQTS